MNPIFYEHESYILYNVIKLSLLLYIMKSSILYCILWSRLIMTSSIRVDY